MTHIVTRPPVVLSPETSLSQRLLGALKSAQPPDATAQAPQPAQPFSACSAPNEHVAPTFNVRLRRSVVFDTIAISDDPDGLGYAWDENAGAACKLAGAQIMLPAIGDGQRGIELAVDLQLLQTWNLLGMNIGDLASTIALAPGEQLTLEFQNSQRRTLDQTTEDSLDELTSAESSTLDKEVMNVSRMSSNTQRWYVDGQGQYSGGKTGLSASVKAGYSQTIADESKFAIDHTTETTRKSAQTLKTMHKVIVRGTTETFVQNRMTRVIRNPYKDRTLALNVFQLVKQFSVEVALDQLRPVLIVPIEGIDFDAEFVQSNQDFLRSTLLDSSMVDQLATAVIGAQLSQTFDEATAAAKDALYYLFKAPNVFRLPPAVGTWTKPGSPPDPNDPANSLNAGLAGDGSINTAALKESLNHHYSVMLVIMNFFYRVYLDYSADAGGQKLDRYAVFLAKAIQDNAVDYWTSRVKDPKDTDVEALFDNQNYTEIFRRLPGFLAMVNGVVAPLIGEVPQPAGSTPSQDGADPVQQRQNAIHTYQRLVTHLRNNGHYYAQQFLTYVADKTKNQAIVDLIEQLLDALEPTAIPGLIREVFDIDRAFIDRQHIIVPGAATLSQADVDRLSALLAPGSAQSPFSLDEITSSVDTVEVPSDGIHLEVAAGACILGDVPPSPVSIEVNLQGSSLKATGDFVKAN